MPDPSPVLSPLVAQLYDLDAQITALQELLNKAKAELIDEGEGTYLEPVRADGQPQRNAVVVIPTKFSVKYDLYRTSALAAFLEERKVKKATPALIEEFRLAQEARAEALAGEKFKALFDRVVLYPPAKGFADLVPKLLTNAKGEPTAKARDLLLHCQVVKPPGAAYVKLPDKPKKADAEGDEEEEA